MASQRLQKLSKYIPLHQRLIPKYPLYWKGNPQLRVYLPLFWMKMVNPEGKVPKDTARFIVHPQMTKFDIKNYLEKIYNVPVLSVRTWNQRGKEITGSRGGILAYEPDVRHAFVQLGDGQTFEFPEFFPEGKSPESEEMEQFKEMEKKQKETDTKYWDKQDVPDWFR